MKKEKTNLSKQEWKDLIGENDIIQRLNEGEKFSSINIDLGFDGNSDALRKALDSLGYKKDKRQGLYYWEGSKDQKDAIRSLNAVDVEATIEDIAADRYYSALINDFWEERETVSVEIDKEIYDEYLELSEQFGCDIEDEFMIMVLLEGLKKYKPVNRRREHYIKHMHESGEFSKEEIDIIFQKEKEGYNLESMVLLSEDYDMLTVSKETLERFAK